MHSQGGARDWLWADTRPGLIKGSVAMELTGPPFQSAVVEGPFKAYGSTDIPLTHDPPADGGRDGGGPLKTEEHLAANGDRYLLQ